MFNCSDSTGLPTSAYKVEISVSSSEILALAGERQQFSFRSVLWGIHSSGIIIEKLVIKSIPL